MNITQEGLQMAHKKIVPGTGGEHYIPYKDRSGKKSTVYFTEDLSAEGLKKIFERVSGSLKGKIAVKLHTGEQHGPNIIPAPWVKELIADKIPEAHIVETNTYYEGDRYTTEKHRETLKVNGWTFCPVDILDEDGTAKFPVKGVLYLSTFFEICLFPATVRVLEQHLS